MDYSWDELLQAGPKSHELEREEPQNFAAHSFSNFGESFLEGVSKFFWRGFLFCVPMITR